MKTMRSTRGRFGAADKAKDVREDRVEIIPFISPSPRRYVPMGNSETSSKPHASTRSVYKKWNWISLLIAIANLIVYVRMETTGAFESLNRSDTLVSWGATLGERAFSGEAWRFFDCLFVHVDLRHFLGNMCALFLAAPFLISAIGSLPTALVYVVCGGLGNIAAAVTDPSAVVTGASGAIFGLYGAIVAAFLTGKFGSHSDVDRRQLKQAIVLSLPLSLMTSSLPGISFAANLGGMASGFLIGLALTRKSFSSRYSWATVSVAASFIGIFVVTAMTQGTDAAFFQELARAVENTPAGQVRDPAASAPSPVASPALTLNPPTATATATALPSAAATPAIPK